nr:aminopeptidase Ey-like [Osmia lignaria]XP_034185424.1 aminopeptidase Ey-like [Osmia lignaria]
MERGLFNILFLITFSINVCKSDIDHALYRLPEEVVPISYDLWLFTRLGYNDFNYKGYVNISLNVLNKTDVIVVHNDGLLIQKESSIVYRVTSELNESIVPIANQSSDTERQFYILKFSSKLEVGVYHLVLYFEGEVQDGVFGFYRSSYVDNTKTKWMGITQFSPTYARQAFPCMDEPHLKASFILHIGHTRNQTTTSNTVPQSTIKHSNNENYYVTTFAPTPKMSTYLVGWSVHDFVSETSTFSNNLKIWTRRSMNHHGSISLYQSLSIYTFLRKYLLIENPISKLDEIAVPDFHFNAMENWGMITFRESVALYEGGVTATKKMVDGFTTMAHEYAHTWFGNLVTHRFWDVVWLKEGFASYFQYFALSKTQPSWGMMNKFVVDVLQPTLLGDSENHTRTMNGRNVGSPSSIMAMMDFVSYKKGASIIRMLSHVMGDLAFQEGLQSYLKNMSYKAATPSDLYQHLQASLNNSNQLEGGVLIKDFMESWTNKPGFPLVTVTRTYNNSLVLIDHQPFYQYPSSKNRSDWWIPLNFATKSINDFSNTGPSYWLSPEETLILFGTASPNDWIIFNIQQTGYYRVNYDERNWKMLIDYLKSENYRKIHKVNRAALIDDAFNLARAGYLNYSIPFNLSNYLIQETDYEPWVAAVNSFKFLNKMLSSLPDMQQSFQEHVTQLLQPMYEQLSFNESLNEDITTKLSRELILSTSCLVGNIHCLTTSEMLFRSWIASPNKLIPNDLKSFVYCEGIRAGDYEDWYTLLKRWQSTDLHTEYEVLLQALGCTRNTTLINEYLQLSISEPNVRKQYRFTIISAIIDGNTRNVDYVLALVEKNVQTIIKRRGHDFLSKTITAIGNAITTAEQVSKLHSFVDGHYNELGSALKGAKQAITKASETVEWIKNVLPSIEAHFNSNTTMSGSF